MFAASARRGGAHAAITAASGTDAQPSPAARGAAVSADSFELDESVVQLDVIYNEDCLLGMQRLPDNSVDLIATDPPYFRVKGEAWDRQWESPARFIEWIGELCSHWQRVLKPNGSLYVFASPQMAARVEVKIGEWFEILNSITWAKPDPFSAINKGASNSGRVGKESLRSYYPNTERVIFAEHFGSDSIAKGEAVYAAKCDELRGFLFEPLRSYIVQEFEASGIDRIQFNVICGFSPNSGGMASRHYLSASQWALPTPEHYAKLAKATGRFQRPYETLREQYETLRAEYETLRRPFAVSADVPFTDVWTFPTVQAYSGKHPCEKPLAMMEHIITTSSRPGAVVLDSFFGGGTTAIACLNTGRHYIGFEKDPGYFEIAQRRIATHQPKLPAIAAA